VDLTVLSVPGCPNAPALDERLSGALAGLAGVTVHHRVVDSEQEAAEAGMHGSPTLLIDGVDPFAGPDARPSLSCRLYASGRAGGAPSVAALRQVLTEASHD
jgi:hypothetical protein